METTKQVFHLNPPAKCDMDGQPFHDGRMYDARTKDGRWGNLCHKCYLKHGVGLGTGKGQGYKRLPDGRWLKVAG